KKAPDQSGAFFSSSFQNAASKRMLMLAGELHDLRSAHFRLLTREAPACARPLTMDFEHHSLGVLVLQFKNLFQHMHHEIHRRIVIVQELNFERRRTRGIAGWGLRSRPAHDVSTARCCLSIPADPMADEG